MNYCKDKLITAHYIDQEPDSPLFSVKPWETALSCVLPLHELLDRSIFMWKNNVNNYSVTHEPPATDCQSADCLKIRNATTVSWSLESKISDARRNLHYGKGSKIAKEIAAMRKRSHDEQRQNPEKSASEIDRQATCMAAAYAVKTGDLPTAGWIADQGISKGYDCSDYRHQLP